MADSRAAGSSSTLRAGAPGTFVPERRAAPLIRGTSSIIHQRKAAWGRGGDAHLLPRLLVFITVSGTCSFQRIICNYYACSLLTVSQTIL